MDVLTSGGFNQVPANARPAGFYPEVDPSLAGFFQENQLVLLVGQKTSAGTQDAGVPVLVPGDGGAAKDYFGRGSMLANMVAAFRQGNLTNTLWCLPLDDDGAGTAADQDVTITGTATEAGTLNLYIGGTRVQVGVAIDDGANDIAAALEAAIDAALDLPVSASVVDNVVTVACRHKGEIGNDIRLQMNLRGVLGGEKTPAGVSVAIGGTGGYLAGGETNPDQAAAIAAIGDSEYDYICVPYTDDASLDAWDTEMDRRWNPVQQIYGTVWSARNGTVSALNTFGTARNGKYVSVLETYEAPGAAWLRAARYTAQASRALANHPARPLPTLALTGELAPPRDKRFTWADRNTLLFSGIATTRVAPGDIVVIDRAVTTYQKNSFGTPDTAFLDVTTAATLTRIIRELRFVVEQAFIQRRAILVDDDTPIGAGVPHATPAKVKAVLVAHYDKLQLLGYAERKDRFEELLLVNRDPEDPTRLNVRYTPDLANPLVVFAALVQFSLQWPKEFTEAA